MIICDALSDLVPFVQLKKREKHPWRSVTFSKVIAGVTYKHLQKSPEQLFLSFVRPKRETFYKICMSIKLTVSV